MIGRRPPSLQRTYDDFYSGDPAIIQDAPDATPEQKAERMRRIRVARETHTLGDIVVEGSEPTIFSMRPMKGDVYRTLRDMVKSGDIGQGKLYQLAFRSSIIAITNFGKIEIERVPTTSLGELATTEITDLLDDLDLSIVTELGGEVMRRALEAVPPRG